MTIAEVILKTFGADEQLTNEEICDRTGYDAVRVCTYMGRLRARGLVEHVDAGRRPVKHRLAGAARTRALINVTARVPAGASPDGSIVGNALRTQATSIFNLGRFA